MYSGINVWMAAPPLTEWLAHVKDTPARIKLGIRFRRIATGTFGDVKPVGEGVLELREDIGAGYRVYIGRHGTAVVVLLCGGNKGTQQDDIKRAKSYWQDWKRRNT